MKRSQTNGTVAWLWGVRIVGACTVVVALLGIFLLIFPPSPKARVTVVIASNPIGIVTIDTVENTVVILQIPEDIAIAGAYASGRYPISSLWKMGFLDPKDRGLFAESIEQSFGIPVDWYIGHTYEQLFENKNSVEALRDLFSLRSIIEMSAGRRATNIPPLQLFGLRKKISTMRKSDIKVLDMGKTKSAFEEELPDGTTRFVLDPQRIDALIKNIFVVDAVREEALSVGVINTTSVPELASSLARRLTNSGVFVVSVTSEEHALDVCELSGSKEALSTQTATFITALFDCETIVHDASQREDLVIRLGTQNGNGYLPRVTK